MCPSVNVHSPVTITKHPAPAVLDYQFDWTNWLGDDTISTSSMTVPAGITKDADTKTTKTTTIWLSGGTANSSYEVKNTITTAGGRTEYKTLTVAVISAG